MNKTNPFCLLIIFAIAIIFFSACKEKDIPVSGTFLNTNELTLAPGDTDILIATLHPANATNKKVKWNSSNYQVASLSVIDYSNELEMRIIAHNNGKATITVTTIDGNYSATCSVTVQTPDYRDQWVGEWDFVTKHIIYWYLGGGKWDYLSDTIYYTGKVSHNSFIIPEYGIGYIDIKYSANNSISMVVDKSGKLYYYTSPPYYGEGQFEDCDKVIFESGWRANGGGNIYVIDGVKKERGRK